MNEKQRHPTLVRLFEAANVAGPAALAKAMNESEQAVTNWGSRGVSKAAALKAEGLFGRSAGWILTGSERRLQPNGLPSADDKNQPPAQSGQGPIATNSVTDIASRRSSDGVDNALRVLAEAIDRLAIDNRDGVAGLLSSFGRNPGAPGTYTALLALLDSGNARRQAEPPVKYSSLGGR